jgi:hypothetical protein
LGRLAATVFFIFVLQIALAPFMALCVLMGGVSPAEIALLYPERRRCRGGAAVGLWCSARAYRPSSAISLVFGFLLVWTVGALWAPELVLEVPNIFGTIISPVFHRDFRRKHSRSPSSHFGMGNGVDDNVLNSTFGDFSTETICWRRWPFSVSSRSFCSKMRRDARQALAEVGWMNRNNGSMRGAPVVKKCCVTPRGARSPALAHVEARY